jgi:Flp pilus assembly pilin Flp
MKSSEVWQRIAGTMQRYERGQDLAEYAMLIGLIAIVVIGVVALFGSSLTALLAAIASEVGP